MAFEMSTESEEYNDWRGQRANPKRHGGTRAATFTCVVEVVENMVFLTNASSMVTYLIKSMHYRSAEAANMVTNFVGTSFLLTIFGGFISDSFLTRFTTVVIFCAIELLGLIMLTIQAHDTRLQPAFNKKPSNSEAALLYIGLYAIATGVGGIKAALPAHGADQMELQGNQQQRSVSAFFNWFFFSLCTGGLLAQTIMVWVAENLGFKWSFKICIVALSLAIAVFVSGLPLYKFKRPAGSPITRIYQVLVSAFRNRKVLPSVAINDGIGDGSNRSKFRFLDKAIIAGRTSPAELNETKAFLGLLPIFGSTIMMNCCLAQIQTFSVEQGSVMNRKLNNFQIPTQSMVVFPLLIMLSSIPLYERIARTFKSKISTDHFIFNPLKRIGLGLALASGSMAVAALVEVKRRDAAIKTNTTLSVFWLGWQYVLLGVSDMLTLGGMLEFFYSKSPDSMRSMSTSLSWCSTSMGYFLSSLLVSIINSITGKFGHEWLGGHDLNHNRLDLFYTVLCILNLLNLFNYIYWAKKY